MPGATNKPHQQRSLRSFDSHAAFEEKAWSCWNTTLAHGHNRQIGAAYRAADNRTTLEYAEVPASFTACTRYDTLCPDRYETSV
jgi:hypothetical protein